MAKALASQGAKIVAIARRQNLIDEVSAEITGGLAALSFGTAFHELDAVRGDFRREDLGAVLIGIRTGAQASGDADAHSLLKILLDEFGALSKAHDIGVICLSFSVAVGDRTVHGYGESGDRHLGLRAIPDFRVSRESSY